MYINYDIYSKQNSNLEYMIANSNFKCILGIYQQFDLIAMFLGS